MSREEEFQRIVECVRVLKKNEQQAMRVDRNGRRILADLAGMEKLPDSDWDVVEKAFKI